MNYLIIGGGMVGSYMESLGYHVIGRTEFSWPNDIHQLGDYIKHYDVVINALAFTNTKLAQTEPFKSITTNIEYVSFLNSLCLHHDKKLVHISSGCVYNPVPYSYEEYREDTPMSVYTMSKALGDFFVSENNIIVRPRMIFAGFPHPSNLFDKIKNYNKFLTTPQSMTSVNTLTEAIFALVEKEATGIFNVAQKGVASVMEVAEIMGLKIEGELDISDLKQKKVLTSPEIVLNCEKLAEYYEPRNILDEVALCYSAWSS